MLLSRRAIAPTLTLTEPDGRRYTYEDFVRLIQFWRGWLDDQGLSKGDTVMIVMLNTTEVLALKLACFEAGLVVVALNQMQFHRIPRYAALGVTAVFGTQFMIDQIESEGGYPARLIELPENVDYASVPFDPVGEIVADADTFAIKALTSGTTGEAQEILHTHRTLATAAQRALGLFYVAEDRVSLYMNMNHLGVVTTFTLPVIFGGCQIHVCRYSNSSQIIANLKRDKVNKLLMFPWLWFLLLEEYKKSGGTEPLLADVDLILSGGEPLSSEFLDSVMRQGAQTVCSSYGATEAPPPVINRTISRADFDRADYEADSRFQFIGEPVSGWEVEVRDTLIRLKGESIGYDKDGTSLVESDGFMTTQDVGEITGTEVYYGGRVSNIKRNGQTIFVSDITVMVSMLFQRSKLAGQAFLLIATRSEETDISTILLVVNRAFLQRNDMEFTMTLEEVNSYLTEALSPDHVIDHLVFEDEFPNNDLKADRAALRKKYCDLFK